MNAAFDHLAAKTHLLSTTPINQRPNHFSALARSILRFRRISIGQHNRSIVNGVYEECRSEEILGSGQKL